ncbi:SMP-30/gluconolactonase/LRE family protein [Roseisalinus antarcticus]|uniref:L-arabinolactonase n=1 Tax=Roseisalinus antarcticus TaxID=254357 RepID=A0A1Y5TTY8_9RHOB|nr:SMP-30/gluconolactonase/LRE family protein [Roseisalinus antarcticus]SLN72593.1 L-arabinolactonase [Roseisalinus antarcticus]
MIFDDTICTLGEGPLWHPERGQLFWFDIANCRLHTSGKQWDFDLPVSAAGWVDRDRMLIASARGLHLFDIETGAFEDICPLEADRDTTRSNDGRADPQGGFWIGTMAQDETQTAGAFYRFYRGELRQLWAGIAIPNATCFAPDGRTAYVADTGARVIWKVALDGEGWPDGEREVHIDLTAEGLNPDGAVVDAEGNLWNAQWQAHRVAAYGPDGRYLTAIGLPAAQTTCPAFGGADLSTLYCTSAAIGLDDPLNPHHGKTFAVATGAKGQAEHRVIL